MGRALAILALVVECAIDLTGIVAGLIYPDRRLAIPGAAIRLVIVIVLGALALRGKTWARVVLAVLVGSTSLVVMGLLVLAASDRKPAKIMLVFAGIAAGYLVLAIAIGTGLRPRKNP